MLAWFALDKTPIKIRFGTAGFTIIETVVGLLLVTVSIFGALQFFASSQKQHHSQSAYLIALHAGGNLMSGLQSHVSDSNRNIYETASIDASYRYQPCIQMMCSDVTLARRDIFFFLDRLLTGLNNPRFYIDIDIESDSARLSIFWQDAEQHLIRAPECRSRAKQTESCVSFYETLIKELL